MLMQEISLQSWYKSFLHLVGLGVFNCHFLLPVFMKRRCQLERRNKKINFILFLAGLTQELISLLVENIMHELHFVY